MRIVQRSKWCQRYRAATNGTSSTTCVNLLRTSIRTAATGRGLGEWQCWVLTLQLLLRVQSCSGARLLYAGQVECGNGEVGQTPALKVDGYTVIRCEREAPVHYFL